MTKHTLACMDKTGDTKVVWDPHDEESVAEARRTFNMLKKKNFAFFRQKGSKGNVGSSEKGKVIREFDPDAREIIAVPPLAGG